MQVMLTAIIGGVFSLLSRSECGRNLLLKVCNHVFLCYFFL